MVVRGWRAGVVTVAGRQAWRLVLQILDQVTRLDRVVNGSVGWCERNRMETFPVIRPCCHQVIGLGGVIRVTRH